MKLYTKLKYFITILLATYSCLYVNLVFAISRPNKGGGGVSTMGTLAGNIQGSFSAIALLITSGAYIAGFGFAVASILKFKAHKDNPTQIPVGTPVALLFIAVALIFMPSLFNIGGHTVFGSGMTAGGVTGVTDIASTS